MKGTKVSKNLTIKTDSDSSKRANMVLRKKRPLSMSLIGWFLTLRAILMPASTARLAQRLMFSPRRLAVQAEDVERLKSASRRDISYGSDRSCVYAWGEGERQVLVVHGWSGGASQFTSFVQPLLDKGFRVVMLDMPAHGSADGRMSSVVHFARALDAVRKEFGPFYAVLAHSLGAAAVTHAVSTGMDVTRAVFVAPVTSYDMVWERFQQMLGVPQKLVNDAKVEAERWLSIRFSDIEPLTLATDIDLPLLVVHDQDDRECPFLYGERLVDAWAGAKLMPTQKLGHVRILREPEVVSACIKFLISEDD